VKLRIAIGPGASREFGGRAKPARLLNGVASAALAAQVRFAGAAAAALAVVLAPAATALAPAPARVQVSAKEFFFSLSRHKVVAGPAIVEQRESTAVLGPSDTATIDDELNLVVAVGAAKGPQARVQRRSEPA